jgi:ABC-2 type transport system permease protein
VAALAPTTLPLYRLLLRTQATRGRVLALIGAGVVGIVVALAIGSTDSFEPAERGARFVNAFGLSLLVPVTALVFASASLGDLREDGTLVYLWLRPVRRARIVVAAAASALTLAWPLVVVPLAAAAAATGGGRDLVVGTVAASTLALVAYTGLFCALGLMVRRALVWGLLYIFIWEGFIATANDTAARLAVRSYARSVLNDIAAVTLRFAEVASPYRWVVPPLVAIVALAYATHRLAHQDVA